jgi:hypothetical protein
MLGSSGKEPLFKKTIEDLTSLVFEELDPACQFFWYLEGWEMTEDFIEFLLLVFILQCGSRLDHVDFKFIYWTTSQ